MPIGLALIPLALLRLRETRGPNDALDLPGVALASAGLFGIVWGLVRGNGVGWGSLEITTAFVLADDRARAVRGLGAARACADAAAAVLPQPHLHGGERRVAS